MRCISVNGVLSGMGEAYHIMCKRMHMTGEKILQDHLVKETMPTLAHQGFELPM